MKNQVLAKGIVITLCSILFFSVASWKDIALWRALVLSLMCAIFAVCIPDDMNARFEKLKGDDDERK